MRHSVRKNVISSPYRQLTALCQDLLLFQVESWTLGTPLQLFLMILDALTLKLRIDQASWMGYTCCQQDTHLQNKKWWWNAVFPVGGQLLPSSIEFLLLQSGKRGKGGTARWIGHVNKKQECSISIHSLEATKITPKYMLFAFNEAQKLFLKNLLAERMWIFERLSCQNHQIPRRITQPKATYRVWKTWRAFLRGVRAQCPVRSRE